MILSHHWFWEFTLQPTSPMALFITWTTYGSFLPGDHRGWRHRTQGEKQPQPKLLRWHQEHLAHAVLLLDRSMIEVVASAVTEICEYRRWHLFACSVRSNHVHVVLAAPDWKPPKVRDQLKSKATMELRASNPAFRDRPVWTRKGDIAYLDSDVEIERCVTYVLEAQDRKIRDQMWGVWSAMV
ncbi:transposase [Rhodopirellula sallentina]|uniref:Transposase IS200-like domain-containing protein n=1 Tax=Rhodopirellula sallentina SM41 TaxID=1263870 RepID=M5UB26_9BACT|nr:transposase [Rhodopirellula sallentina]EMI55051.1 hypothetical protein RSSM_03510 [Rhodopirellula sallentina SM41]